MVELRRLAGDDGRMLVRQAEHAGAELDPLGLRYQRREEHEGRLDRLRGEREMLAEPDLVEADRVRAFDDFQVFLKERVVAPFEVLNRVHEHAELHGAPPGPVALHPMPRIMGDAPGPRPMPFAPGRARSPRRPPPAPQPSAQAGI